LTFHDVAIGEADMVQGRFASVSKTQVTGAGPDYPRLPEGSPWRDEQIVEPPLGFPIDQLEPVGTAQEIEKSLGEANPGDVGQLLPKVADSALPDEGAGSTRWKTSRRRVETRPRRF
jgi:hypothetical protein